MMTSTLSQPIAENIVFLNPVSWETFNQLLEELGNKRSQRLAYDKGHLEIMTPLGEHENSNRFIESLIFIITDELGLNLKKFGSLTLKSQVFKQGVEPDSCYYLKNEPQVRNKQNLDLASDPPPDLVLEIDITSTSLNKFSIYGNLKVPEIWQYNGQELIVFILKPESKKYQKVTNSQVFPFLEINLIPQLIRKSLEVGETRALREFRQWVRSHAS
jgi:Uma2 family endonuclease